MNIQRNLEYIKADKWNKAELGKWQCSRLVELYFEHIPGMNRFLLHAPIEETMDQVYNHLDRMRRPRSSDATFHDYIRPRSERALLLAIIAQAKRYHWKYFDPFVSESLDAIPTR